MKMMVFSGDTDGVLPTYGTRKWIKNLGWEKKTQVTKQWTVNE